VPIADTLMVALDLGGGAGATAAEAGTLPSAPSPIAMAAILNLMRCNSPLLSCWGQALPASLLRDNWIGNVGRAPMFRIWSNGAPCPALRAETSSARR
jgi:hypothetical protein